MLTPQVRSVQKDFLGAVSEKFVRVRPGSTMRWDSKGNLRPFPHGYYDSFQLLPAAAVAAGTNQTLKTVGTGTEVIARSTNGAVNLKTQASTPADNDNCVIVPNATTSHGYVPISTRALPRLDGAIAFTQVTKMFASFGLDENAASADADPSGTSGDGASFVFAPTGAATELTVDPGLTQITISSITRTGDSVLITTATAHGLAVDDIVPITGATEGEFNGQFRVLSVPSTTTLTIVSVGSSASVTGSPIINWYANLMCHYKIAGVDAFLKTNVMVEAGRIYELSIEWDTDLKARFYVDGVLVATASTANTANASVGLMAGVENTGTPVTQHDIDVLYVNVGRSIG